MTHDVVLGKVVLGQSKNYRDSYEIVPEPSLASSKELIAYWRSCEERGGLVMNRDIPSRTLSKLIHGLSVIEPVDDGVDFRVRLFSADSTQRFGRSPSGCLISELSPQINSWYREFGNSVLSSRQPLIAIFSTSSDGLSMLRMEVVLLPMFSPGGEVPWLLVSGFPFE